MVPFVTAQRARLFRRARALASSRACLRKWAWPGGVRGSRVLSGPGPGACFRDGAGGWRGQGRVGRAGGPHAANPHSAGSRARSSVRSSGSRGVPASGGLLASDLDAFGASRLGVGARWGGECTPRSSAQPFRVKVDRDPPATKPTARLRKQRNALFSRFVRLFRCIKACLWRACSGHGSLRGARGQEESP